VQGISGNGDGAYHIAAWPSRCYVAGGLGYLILGPGWLFGGSGSPPRRKSKSG